ncbi:immunoglobulin-like domain-containing protein [Halobacillus sp. A5]|uniref:immunoglobulin-like domain-containing protein n=1 Tax=Halobacillus sp. A5 TaxID=2880263 RepID=UPI0020A6A8F8|nr:immunoglobulin-like domain-containing protein [Halobacillus sp. A5]MCP3027136.1 hypothetical protein [Halobacillus sp. A5]
MKFSILLFTSILLLSGCLGETNAALGETSKYGDLKSSYSEGHAEILMTTDKELYSPGEAITVQFENKGEAAAGYGAALYLEKRDGDSWRKVPYEDLSFTSESLSLSASSSEEQELPLEYIEGSLTDGTYRITKSFSVHSENVVLAAFFEVSE